MTIMQITFDQGTSTVWMFATPDELLQIAAMAQQRITEARLGDSLIAFEESISKSNLVFKISADNVETRS